MSLPACAGTSSTGSSPREDLCFLQREGRGFRGRASPAGPGRLQEDGDEGTLGITCCGCKQIPRAGAGGSDSSTQGRPGWCLHPHQQRSCDRAGAGAAMHMSSRVWAPVPPLLRKVCLIVNDPSATTEPERHELRVATQGSHSPQPAQPMHACRRGVDCHRVSPERLP